MLDSIDEAGLTILIVFTGIKRHCRSAMPLAESAGLTLLASASLLHNCQSLSSGFALGHKFFNLAFLQLSSGFSIGSCTLLCLSPYIQLTSPLYIQIAPVNCILARRGACLEFSYSLN